MRICSKIMRRINHCRFTRHLGSEFVFQTCVRVEEKNWLAANYELIQIPQKLKFSIQEKAFKLILVSDNTLIIVTGSYVGLLKGISQKLWKVTAGICEDACSFPFK